MKNIIEKAQFIGRKEDIKKLISRVYFGNEFCENLIPAITKLKEIYFYATGKNKNFTFVTPFVTNSGIRKTESLLEFLNRQNNVEVVFNDWGVFKLIKNNFNNLKPILGRLLTKQRRDPRILKILLNKQVFKEFFSEDKKKKLIIFPKKTPQSVFKYFQSSMINAKIFQNYLLSQGITRVEIDNLAWKMNVKLDKNIGVSVYLPYGYITTTRKCGLLTLTYAACKKECKKYYLQLGDKSLPVPFYSIGNTIFYKSSIPSDDYLEKLGVDRVVYQTRLPF